MRNERVYRFKCFLASHLASYVDCTLPDRTHFFREFWHLRETGIMPLSVV